MGVLSRSSVQTLTRRIVKPYFPTPSPLRCYKLSLLDQMCLSNYMPVSFFFPDTDKARFPGKDQLFTHIERSLAKVLSYYYPLAGRLVGNDSVNCNDAGIELIQAQLNCPLSEILGHSESPHGEDLVLPEGVSWEPTHSTSSLLVAQVTHFDCQGYAISLCMPHKIADAFSMISFINDWAAISRQTNHVPSPSLIGASVFPPTDKVLPSPQVLPPSNPVSRRFIFTASKISKLKAMAIQLGVEQPTRVEVVSALLFRCAIVASGSFRPSFMAPAQNLRNFVASPDPKNLFGNFSFPSFVFGTNENNTRFEELVAQIKKAKTNRGTLEVLKSDEKLQEYYQMLQGEHGGHKLDHFCCTSLCGFPYHRVDFGWGRPIHIGAYLPPVQKMFMLCDTPDGEGIEAYVTLEKSHMESFERNQELLSFAAPAHKSDMRMPPKLFGKL